MGWQNRALLLNHNSQADVRLRFRVEGRDMKTVDIENGFAFSMRLVLLASKRKFESILVYRLME